MVLLATPSLIKVAKLKHLVDMPGEDRKLHKRSVPTIGGIIIFSAIIFSYALWFPDVGNLLHQDVRDFKYLIAVLIILFFIGIKDDIIGTAPMKKLVAHLVVALDLQPERLRRYPNLVGGVVHECLLNHDLEFQRAVLRDGQHSSQPCAYRYLPSYLRAAE